MSAVVIGQLSESGKCDDCVNLGDKTDKLVKRVLDCDNIYLCSSHWKIFNKKEESHD